MKQTKFIYNALYYFIFVFLGTIVRLLYPIRVLGKKNLIKGGEPFVLGPNHIRAIDPMYVLLGRGIAKKMLVMSKVELFGRNKFLDFFWKIVGAFPVDRGTGNKDVLAQFAAEVQKGRGLLLFPEGTRSKDGNLGKLKSGAFVVAWQAGCSMIPCRIWYSKGKPKLFRRITVMFGKPITLQELGLTGEYSVKKIREAKRVYTKALEDLYEEYKDRL